MKFLNIKSLTFSALFLGLAQTSAMGFNIGATDFSGTQEVEKVLLLDIDVSSSVKETTVNGQTVQEYDLMMDGYANAFRNDFIQNAILYWDENNTKLKKGIVVGVQFWSTQQQMLVYNTNTNTYVYNATSGYGDSSGNDEKKWFLLQNESDINAFADLLNNAPRPPKTVNNINNNPDVIGGGTNLAGALDRSEAELNALLNPTGDVTYSGSTPNSNDTVTATNTQGVIENVRQETIVDVSSDGYHDRETLDGNDGSCDDRKDGNTASRDVEDGLGTGYILDCQQVLTDAILDLVTDTNAPADRINALPILGEEQRYRDILDDYYRDGITVTGGQIGPVITGNNAFAETANDFTDFERAILAKLEREVPFEFSPALGLILGGGIFGGLHWFKKLKK